jgi:hypothetical protein
MTWRCSWSPVVLVWFVHGVAVIRLIPRRWAGLDTAGIKRVSTIGPKTLSAGAGREEAEEQPSRKANVMFAFLTPYVFQRIEARLDLAQPAAGA